MPAQNSTLPSKHTIAVCVLLLFGLLLSSRAPSALAQGSASNQEERKRAMELFDQNKFAEAIPILEKLVKASPNDVAVLERLGWATLVVAGSMKDPQERKAARERAGEYLLRAQKLGDTSELLRKGLEILVSPDTAEMAFSSNAEADRAMREGEEAHTKGDLDKAIAAYQRALQLDPKLYFAALFAGDMYFKKGYQASDPRTKKENMDKAGEWFARAIAIDENIETAHRYWGDALMNLGNQEEAKARFVDAIIAEPGNRSGYVGLSQWAERNQVSMAHPEIEIPVKLTLSGDKKLDVYIDPALRNSADGSGAWEHYAFVRAKWVVDDFAKAFPNEKVYRHTLREETEALHKAAEVASEMLKTGKVKSLSPSLAALVKLNEAGLLEPYIFFARADQGITRDYAAYRQANREKIRRYWKEFVISR
jgi:tetratricopeptide (TPR) repeat protein